MTGQIVRFLYRGNIYSDTAVVILGVAIMALTAWLPEWRENMRVGSQHAIGIIVLSLLLPTLPTLGQDGIPGRAPAPIAAPADAAAPMPSPFSQDCQIGGAADRRGIAAAQCRRRLAKAQADQNSGDRRVDLARSPVFAHGSHTDQIEHILEHAIKGLDVVMINRGVSGELAAQAAPRIKNRVALDEPDLVLWQVGTNDALAYVPLDGA